MTNILILKRLYKEYTSRFLPKILLSVFFSIIVAGSTSAIAYLLDPAIKKIFIEKQQLLKENLHKNLRSLKSPSQSIV